MMSTTLRVCGSAAPTAQERQSECLDRIGEAEPVDRRLQGEFGVVDDDVPIDGDLPRLSGAAAAAARTFLLRARAKRSRTTAA
jgi:hypothetical protein